MVHPTESSHFGFYAPGSETEVMDLRDMDIYLEDRIGLRQLVIIYCTIEAPPQMCS